MKMHSVMIVRYYAVAKQVGDILLYLIAMIRVATVYY